MAKAAHGRTAPFLGGLYCNKTISGAGFFEMPRREVYHWCSEKSYNQFSHKTAAEGNENLPLYPGSLRLFAQWADSEYGRFFMARRSNRYEKEFIVTMHKQG